MFLEKFIHVYVETFLFVDEMLLSSLPLSLSPYEHVQRLSIRQVLSDCLDSFLFQDLQPFLGFGNVWGFEIF
jgi:hypothetical protein